MYGKEDPWVKPVWGLEVKKRVPEAPYYEISPAGHCPHDEVPEVYFYCSQDLFFSNQFKMDSKVFFTSRTRTTLKTTKNHPQELEQLNTKTSPKGKKLEGTLS